jgi:hypothetical protein
MKSIHSTQGQILKSFFTGEVVHRANQTSPPRVFEWGGLRGGLFIWLWFPIAFCLLMPIETYGLSIDKGIVEEKTIIDPSVHYIHYRRALPSGKGVDIYVLKIRLDDKTLEIKPALEGGQIKDSAILADIAKSEDAIGAINGGFFFEQNGRKLPVGELIIDGNLLSHSDVKRGSFLVDGDGEYHFGVLKIDAYLNPKDYYEPVPIHAMNVPPGGIKDAVQIYNRYWGTSTPNGDCVEVTVDGGIVQSKTSGSGATPIPENSYVIAFRGGWIPTADRFKVGLLVGMIYDFEGEKETIRDMLTAGPMFIKEGWYREFADEYRFSSNVTAPANRSAVCRTWNNEILFVCTRSAALSYSDFASLLNDLNVKDAVGLDGGGSSGMWVDGANAPTPSRAVPNALVLVHKAEGGTEGNITSGGLWGK